MTREPETTTVRERLRAAMPGFVIAGGAVLVALVMMHPPAREWPLWPVAVVMIAWQLLAAVPHWVGGFVAGLWLAVVGLGIQRWMRAVGQDLAGLHQQGQQHTAELRSLRELLQARHREQT